jgi:hypothetical protein
MAAPECWTPQTQAEYERAVRVLTALLPKPQQQSTKRKCAKCGAFKPCKATKFNYGKTFVCSECVTLAGEAVDRG